MLVLAARWLSSYLRDAATILVVLQPLKHSACQLEAAAPVSGAIYASAPRMHMQLEPAHDCHIAGQQRLQWVAYGLQLLQVKRLPAVLDKERASSTVCNTGEFYLCGQDCRLRV